MRLAASPANRIDGGGKAKFLAVSLENAYCFGISSANPTIRPEKNIRLNWKLAIQDILG